MWIFNFEVKCPLTLVWSVENDKRVGEKNWIILFYNKGVRKITDIFWLYIISTTKERKSKKKNMAMAWTHTNKRIKQHHRKRTRGRHKALRRRERETVMKAVSKTWSSLVSMAYDRVGVHSLMAHAPKPIEESKKKKKKIIKLHVKPKWIEEIHALRKHPRKQWPIPWAGI